ncbi:hypothetical protein [Stenotrophomonas indicatrix]|jgi:hypothetical protein|uniref:hypothetical protein n=1 Tax=Stenotrophomonas indicatrix TaxID=2045451 RepID=UPI0011241499|nr:hypothetical protein [Stenotrophomonas indicatrix]TPD98467.1 hypothetical protein FJP65_05660 [Stenotrophomonas maltophilia]
MKAEEFVSAIQHYVLESAVENTISNLARPPGRRVASELSARSEWFNSLSDGEAEMLRAVARDAAHSAVFGFLAVLDGARVIDPEKGTFELYHLGRQKSLVNAPGTDLHDMLG